MVSIFFPAGFFLAGISTVLGKRPMMPRDGGEPAAENLFSTSPSPRNFNFRCPPQLPMRVCADTPVACDEGVGFSFDKLSARAYDVASACNARGILNTPPGLSQRNARFRGNCPSFFFFLAGVIGGGPRSRLAKTSVLFSFFSFSGFENRRHFYFFSLGERMEICSCCGDSRESRCAPNSPQAGRRKSNLYLAHGAKRTRCLGVLVRPASDGRRANEYHWINCARKSNLGQEPLAEEISLKAFAGPTLSGGRPEGGPGLGPYDLGRSASALKRMQVLLELVLSSPPFGAARSAADSRGQHEEPTTSNQSSA